MDLSIRDVCIVTIITILTVIGLSLYIFVMPCLIPGYRTSRQPFYILMISLALPEIFWLILTLIYSIPTMILGSELFGQTTERIMGNIDTIVYFMQLTHLFFISINRLRCVARSSTEICDKVFTIRKVIIWSCILWLFSIGNGLLLETGSCVKFMDHYYWSMNCSTNSSMSVMVKMTNATLSNLFPFASAVIYMILWIIIKIKRNKITIGYKYSWKKNVSLTIQFSMVTALLIVESLAYWILPLVYDKAEMSAVAHIFAVACASVNPYIYLLFNQQIRIRLKRWFSKTPKIEPLTANALFNRIMFTTTL